MPEWKTLSGKQIKDITEWVKELAKEGQIVHIGTDSLGINKHTQFVTVVAILTPMKGGRVAYLREVVPRINSLREKLLKEVWRSVDLGIVLHPHIPGDLTVHIDANPILKHKSSKYIQELTSLVVSQGFKAQLKPDAWAASHCADHIVRVKGKLPRELKREQRHKGNEAPVCSN